MLLHEDITAVIIKCFYKVYNTLGYGFLEKVYENALVIELRNEGLICFQQTPVTVFYQEYEVGKYYADINIANLIILEIKAGAGGIIVEHELQLMNYLRATSFQVGLILHFGKTPTFKRKIVSNVLKQKSDKPA